MNPDTRKLAKLLADTTLRLIFIACLLAFLYTHWTGDMLQSIWFGVAACIFNPRT